MWMWQTAEKEGEWLTVDQKFNVTEPPWHGCKKCDGENTFMIFLTFLMSVCPIKHTVVFF